jgi:hypothetical protein
MRKKGLIVGKLWAVENKGGRVTSSRMLKSDQVNIHFAVVD